MMRREVSTPTSDEMRISSISSQTESSRREERRRLAMRPNQRSRLGLTACSVAFFLFFAVASE